MEALQHLTNTTDSQGSSWSWKGSVDCRASTIRSTLISSLPPSPVYNLIWHPQGAPKISVCALRALQNKLPTADKIFSGPQVCYLCRSQSESIQHIFFNCQYSCYIWDALRRKLGLQGCSAADIEGEAMFLMGK